ncbi:MAG: hypothetical protein PSX80_09825 [bacterium]|nr:hypothetical protein [bacterium]
MKTSTAFFWFFVAVCFITAAAAVAYFASGESYRGTDQENYTILLQIPIGIVAFLYGMQKIEEARPNSQNHDR